jgi:hypothetical protein
MNLEQLLKVYEKHFYLLDTGAIEVALGAVAANRLPGDPVWLLLIGPPASGKTEILTSLSGLPDIHEVSTITQAGLLTLPPKGADGKAGGLLAAIGELGIIVCKDFTSILSESPDSRTALMAALREIYDGSWVRHLGSQGGKRVGWSGKVGVIGGVTEVIDLHSAAIGSMGERFIFFRLPEHNHEQRLELGRSSMKLTGHQSEMRIELAEAVATFFDGLPKVKNAEMSPERAERLVLLADLATRCRSSVERSGNDRQIELVPQAEAIGRLQSELVQLGRGLSYIGVEERRVDQLLTKVALDGMSKTRRAIVDLFATNDPDTKFTSRDGADRLQLPTPVTTRALEDLAAHGVIERTGSDGSHYWRSTRWLRDRWDRKSVV